jgi:hypothetical protein
MLKLCAAGAAPPCTAEKERLVGETLRVGGAVTVSVTPTVFGLPLAPPLAVTVIVPV